MSGRERLPYSSQLLSSVRSWVAPIVPLVAGQQPHLAHSCFAQQGHASYFDRCGDLSGVSIELFVFFPGSYRDRMGFSAFQVVLSTVQLSVVAEEKFVKLFNWAREDDLQHFDLLPIRSSFFVDADLHIRVVKHSHYFRLFFAFFFIDHQICRHFLTLPQRRNYPKSFITAQTSKYEILWFLSILSSSCDLDTFRFRFGQSLDRFDGDGESSGDTEDVGDENEMFFAYV